MQNVKHTTGERKKDVEVEQFAIAVGYCRYKYFILVFWRSGSTFFVDLDFSTTSFNLTLSFSPPNITQVFTINRGLEVE